MKFLPHPTRSAPAPATPDLSLPDLSPLDALTLEVMWILSDLSRGTGLRFTFDAAGPFSASHYPLTVHLSTDSSAEPLHTLHVPLRLSATGVTDPSGAPLGPADVTGQLMTQLGAFQDRVRALRTQRGQA